MDIKSLIGNVSAEVYRVVESQERVATMNIVDTLAEQALLEDLLEASKPVAPQGRHYLIQTPFRYPPLDYGSRFGSRFEPSLFYGGLSLSAALCESAFYSFYFLSRSLQPYPGAVMIHKTSFMVTVKSKRYVNLAALDDVSLQQQLTDPSDYSAAQALGKDMRTQGVEAFSYRSARNPDLINMGVFSIDAIKGEPFGYLQWQIKLSENHMLCYCLSEPNLSQNYSKDAFLINGHLPHPAP